MKHPEAEYGNGGGEIDGGEGALDTSLVGCARHRGAPPLLLPGDDLADVFHDVAPWLVRTRARGVLYFPLACYFDQLLGILIVSSRNLVSL
jgi:hypothetical protein